MSETLGNIAGGIGKLGMYAAPMKGIVDANVKFLKRFTKEAKAERIQAQQASAKTARDNKLQAEKFLVDLDAGLLNRFGELTDKGKEQKKNQETQNNWNKRKEERETAAKKKELEDLRTQKKEEQAEAEKQIKKQQEYKASLLQKQKDMWSTQAKAQSSDMSKLHSHLEKMGEPSDEQSALNENISSLIKQGQTHSIPEGERRVQEKNNKSLYSTSENTANMSEILQSSLDAAEGHHQRRSKMALWLNAAQAKQTWQQMKDAQGNKSLFEGMQHMAHQNWVATGAVTKELVRIHSVLVGDSSENAKKRLARMSQERGGLLNRESELSTELEKRSPKIGIPGINRRAKYSTMTELNDAIARGDLGAEELGEEMKVVREETALKQGAALKTGPDGDDEGDYYASINKSKLTAPEGTLAWPFINNAEDFIKEFPGLGQGAEETDLTTVENQLNQIIALGDDGNIRAMLNLQKNTLPAMLNLQKNTLPCICSGMKELIALNTKSAPKRKSYGNLRKDFAFNADVSNGDSVNGKGYAVDKEEWQKLRNDKGYATDKLGEDVAEGIENGNIKLSRSGLLMGPADLKKANLADQALIHADDGPNKSLGVNIHNLGELVELFRGEGRNTIIANKRGDIDGSDPGLSWWAEDEGYAARFGDVKSKKFDMANKSMFNITPIANMEQGFGDLLNPDKHKDIESLNHTSSTAKMFQELLAMDREREDGKLHNSQRGQHLLYGEGGDTAVKYLKELGYDGISLGGQWGDTHAFFPEDLEKKASAFYEAGTEKGSIYTHDQGLHDRLDKMFSNQSSGEGEDIKNEMEDDKKDSRLKKTANKLRLRNLENRRELGTNGLPLGRKGAMGGMGGMFGGGGGPGGSPGSGSLLGLAMENPLATTVVAGYVGKGLWATAKLAVSLIVKLGNKLGIAKVIGMLAGRFSGLAIASWMGPAGWIIGLIGLGIVIYDVVEMLEEWDKMDSKAMKDVADDDDYSELSKEEIAERTQANLKKKFGKNLAILQTDSTSVKRNKLLDAQYGGPDSGLVKQHSKLSDATTDLNTSYGTRKKRHGLYRTTLGQHFNEDYDFSTNMDGSMNMEHQMFKSIESKINEDQESTNDWWNPFSDGKGSDEIGLEVFSDSSELNVFDRNANIADGLRESRKYYQHYIGQYNDDMLTYDNLDEEGKESFRTDNKKYFDDDGNKKGPKAFDGKLGNWSDKETAEQRLKWGLRDHGFTEEGVANYNRIIQKYIEDYNGTTFSKKSQKNIDAKNLRGTIAKAKLIKQGYDPESDEFRMLYLAMTDFDSSIGSKGREAARFNTQKIETLPMKDITPGTINNGSLKDAGITIFNNNDNSVNENATSTNVFSGSSMPIHVPAGMTNQHP